MSAGIFSFTFYTATYAALVHPIRVQPETLTASAGSPAVVNAPPAGPATNPISAKATGSRRGVGLVARRVTLVNTAAVPPAGYKVNGVTTIPCLTPAFFAACTLNSTVTYLGSTWRVASRTAEIAK
jgi:hypothetical protein